MQPPAETILLAVTGLSPAIVTETVWALATRKPRVLPKRVIFITTQSGAKKVSQQLHTELPAFDGQTAWQTLRAALSAGEDELIAEEPRLIGQANEKTGRFDPLNDIQTPEQNALAAGFILEEVRRIVENPDLRLVASIAGGRKTMGALLHAAVSLIGRESDRITHVLVDAPYDTMPGFFFPGQPGPALKDREGKEYAASHASVYLAEVPFVPLRNRFKELDDMPGGFGGLQRRFSRELKEDADRPRLIEISHRKQTFWVDEHPIKMRNSALALLHFMLAHAKSISSMGKQDEMLDPLNVWLKEEHGIPLGLKPLQMGLGEITRQLSHLRITLEKGNATWRIPKGFPLHLPAAILRLREA